MTGTRILPVVAAVAMAFTACATSVRAHPRDVKITGIYSDMSMHDGDVTGNEAFILFTNLGYYVAFQRSEGDPSVPVVVPADVHGNAISFTLPKAIDPRVRFTAASRTASWKALSTTTDRPCTSNAGRVTGND